MCMMRRLLPLFGCGASGDAISFLREHLVIFREALEALLQNRY